MQPLPELPPDPTLSASKLTQAGEIPALEPYLAQLVLAKATELARSGHYQDAEALLDGLKSGKDQPAVLDLLARMRAQQGRWLEAEAYWKQALQQDPTNPAYLQGLQYIQRSRRPAKLSRFFSGTTLLWVLALALLILSVLGVRRLNSLKTDLGEVSKEISSLQAGLSQPQATILLPTQVIPTYPVEAWQALQQEVQGTARLNQAELEDLQDQVTAVQAAQETLLRSLQPTPTPALALDLTVPGTRLLEQEGGWVVQFEEGLFPYGWALSQAARQTLDAVSLQLKPYLAQIEVSIVGFKSSDEQDEYFDLGLMRSVVVLDYLKNSAQISTDPFSIRPQGRLAPPYPNDTLAERSRNRTVILLIRLKTP